MRHDARRTETPLRGASPHHAGRALRVGRGVLVGRVLRIWRSVLVGRVPRIWRRVPVGRAPLAALGCLLAGALAQAADPQPYRVDLASTGVAALDATLRASSNLVTLREGAPVSPFGLIARARADVDRLKTVLESFGYYQAGVRVQIDAHPLEDPGLPELLAALPAKQVARIGVSFVLGPLYHLGDIRIEGDLPPDAATLDLHPGAPAVAADVLAAGARLQSELQDHGHAFAAVDPPVAYEDAREPLLDVVFHVTAGPTVNVGAIRVEGLKHVHESMVRRRLLLHPGEPYSARKVELARQDLVKSGVFNAVTVRLGRQADESGGVPVTFRVQERPGHAVSFNSAYSTDLGGSLGVTWTDRNLFGNGEQLSVATNALNLGGGNTNGVGYDTSVKFIEPDFLRRDQQLQVAVGAVRQFLIAYDQTAATASVSLNRRLSSVWTASVGVSSSVEHIIQAAVPYNYTLLGVPFNVSYDSTDLRSPLDDPTHGMRDSIGITPTRSFGHPTADFLITQAKLAAYLDLSTFLPTRPGRSVLAGRVLAGIAQGAGEYSLPPDQRFYGGGSGTIRGYPYQGVGPQLYYPPPVCAIDPKTHQRSCTPSTDIPIGGTAIIAGSLEWRQRIAGNWGAALFVDGGQVSSSLKPLPSDFYTGIGAGVRYYTPIGPVRLDVAIPTRIYTVDGGRYQVYIGLGQAF
jgi:translocation and assembly module TamA